MAQKVPSIFSTTFYSIGKEAENKGAPDGRVSCRAGKIEMGQGPITSMAQMMAEELDVAYESVDMVMGDTDLCPWGAGTWGSLSTRVYGILVREAALRGQGYPEGTRIRMPFGISPEALEGQSDGEGPRGGREALRLDLSQDARRPRPRDIL